MGKSISHTSASMAYGWNQEKNAVVVLKEYLAGNTPKELTEEFQIIQGMNENCKKNTMSFVLSPTIEDGKRLTKNNLETIAKKFIKRMNLEERQAVAFVHKDKAHTHIHLYVNRIDFKGKAYVDSFIGKRSTEAARLVALEMNLTTAKEVRNEKLRSLKEIRNEIRTIHELLLRRQPTNTFDNYIEKMANKNVQVIPSINKSGKLQGFRFEYKGVNLKGSEVHRSMSGGKILNKLVPNSKGKLFKTVRLSKTEIELNANLLRSINKTIINKGIEL